MKKRKKGLVERRDAYLDENLDEYQTDETKSETVREIFDEDHGVDSLINEEPDEKKKINYIFILGSVLLLVIAVLIIFNPILLKIDLSKKDSAVNDSEQKEEDAIVSDITPFTGSLKLLDKKLGLMDSKFWADFYGDDIEDEAIYYEAGTFNSGDYSGYKRIILLEPQVGPGSLSIKVLATNDDQSYILDGNPSDVGKYATDNWQNPLYGINKEKVTKVANIGSEHLSSISLGNQFNLYRGDIYVASVEEKNSSGDSSWSWQIGAYPGFEEIEADFTDLKVLAQDEYEKSSYYIYLSEEERQKVDQYIKYTNGRSSIIIVDSTGLPYKYYVGNKTATISSIKSIDLNQSSGFYKEYGYAFPGGCGGEADTLIAKGLNDSDLEKITETRKNNIEIYKLRDADHPLLGLAYDEKTGFMYTGDYRQPYTITGINDIRPSYEEYIAKAPLIFFKDPLGRWNMFVEYEYLMPGGCGKPVLYFYPEKPTEITVSFTKDMLLARDIPSYNNGWEILSDENSNIKDLQPDLTNCSDIDDLLKGLEYAKSACEENNYPYIYWAGDVLGAQYPEQKNGWSVARSDLQSFMQEKLNYIGLSEREKNDMLEYWIPEMLEKNTPYYKVSFIQDMVMNSFIPMNIIPKPDSFGRVFLDWLPLSQKIEIQPQKLEKIERNGFTVVEWGGIKK